MITISNKRTLMRINYSDNGTTVDGDFSFDESGGVESVVFYYLPDQSLYEMPHDNCAFGYRTSFFQKTPGCVILSAVFRLEQGDGEEIAARMREPLELSAGLVDAGLSDVRGDRGG